MLSELIKQTRPGGESAVLQQLQSSMKVLGFPMLGFKSIVHFRPFCMSQEGLVFNHYPRHPSVAPHCAQCRETGLRLGGCPICAQYREISRALVYPIVPHRTLLSLVVLHEVGVTHCLVTPCHTLSYLVVPCIRV